jgi:uncharacterized Zn-finger protein
MMTPTKKTATLSPQSLIPDFYPLTPPTETLQLLDSLQMPTNFYFACDSTGVPDAFGSLELTAPQPLLADSLIESLTSQQWNYEDLLLPLMESACPPTSFNPVTTEKPVRTASKPGGKKLKVVEVGGGTRHYCTDCPASFVSKYHLKRHTKKHSESHKFGCTIAGCRVTSHRSDNMAKHIDTHTKRLAKQTGQRERFMASKKAEELVSINVTPVIGSTVLPDDDNVSPTTFFNGVMEEYYSTGMGSLYAA